MSNPIRLTTNHRRRWAVVVVAGALATTTALWSSPALADDQMMTQEGLITEQAKPAVQLIQATFTGNVNVPDWEVNKPAWNAEAEDAATFDDVLEAVNANPAKFFVASPNTRTEEVAQTVRGSGFTVTPDGYVVTNAHVVAPSDAELKAAISEDALKRVQEADVAALEKALGADLTTRQLALLTDAVVKLDAQAMTITDLKKTYEVGVGVGIPGVATGAKAIPADLTVAGETAPGKDVAILKIQGNNLPTVPLGDDATLNTADRLYVVGYPADADISEASVTVPTMTQGAVSAKKTLDNGLTVYQTDAALNPGNSGGPVLNSDGDVVGIATFVIRDETGQKVSGLSFMYPVSLVKEFLSRANVTPSQSITTQKFDEALANYNQMYFSRALPQFQAVAELVPGAIFAQEYIQKTQTAIAEGKDLTPSTVLGMPTWLFLSLLVLLLLVVIGVILLLLLRGRRTSAGPPAAATAPPPPPSGAPVPAAGAVLAPPTGPPAPAPGWTTSSAPTTPNVVTPAGSTTGATATTPTASPATPSAPPSTPPAASPPATPSASPPSSGPMSAATAGAAAAGTTATSHRHGRFCPDCGTAHEPDAHFCPNCGADVT